MVTDGFLDKLAADVAFVVRFPAAATEEEIGAARALLAWKLRAALDAAKAESARLREELRIVSRYAARLYDAARDVARSLGSYTSEWTDSAIRLDKALTIDCAFHVKSGNLCSVESRWPDCTDDTCALRIWHAALQRGREDA